MEKNHKHEEQDGCDDHGSRNDHGSKLELAIDASGFIVPEERVASAHDGAHAVVVRAALHQNDGDHCDACKQKDDRKSDGESEIYVSSRSRDNCCKHYVITPYYVQNEC